MNSQPTFRLSIDADFYRYGGKLTRGRKEASSGENC
jgi:hypothetical protein